MRWPVASSLLVRSIRLWACLFLTLVNVPLLAEHTSPLPRIHANSNQSPAGVLSDGVWRVELEIEEGEWFPESEAGPSMKVFAIAEKGKAPQIPGPLLRVAEGMTLVVSVHNFLPVPVVVHGLHSRPGKVDDYIEIPSGQAREVKFSAATPGAYYYWVSAGGDTWNGRPYKDDSQLNGAFIVDPKNGAVTDRVFVIGMWRDRQRPDESLDIATINGKSWPHSERLTYTAGSEVRWRWLNPTGQPHPMHMHGSYFRVDSLGDDEQDNLLAPGKRKLAATQVIPPGGTMSTFWQPSEPGRWLFHCHTLAHATPEIMAFRQTGAGHLDHDPLQHMSGLVMGINVAPRPGEHFPSKPPKPKRTLDLVASNLQGGVSSKGYALISGKSSVAPTSPGPTLVLTQNEPVAIRVTNRLNEPTAVHWHGIELQSYYDGVPGWTGHDKQVTPPIAPGKSFVAHMTPPHAGTFIYHTHLNDLSQMSSGLYGALVVLPRGETFQPETDRVFIISRNGMRRDGTLLWNGEAQPRDQFWKAGVHYRLRFIDISSNNNATITLTQNDKPITWTALAKDGADLPSEQRTSGPASFIIFPGETYDFEFVPEQSGEIKASGSIPLFKETVSQSWHVDPGTPGEGSR
jgi:manganese oxidase